jgi:hypothetical protein
LFVIDGNEVRFISGQSLDFETQSIYSVRVRATDQTGKYVEKVIELGIENAIEIVGSPTLGDGSTQRSRVSSVSIAFDGDVTILDGAFSVARRGDQGGAVDVSITIHAGPQGNTIAMLTFSGGFTLGGSLIDGNYDLRIDATKITNNRGELFDGGKQGEASDFVFGQEAADRFYRLYGDANGDRSVGLIDFNQFRANFGKTSDDENFNEIFDYFGDGSIGLADFNQFRNRFGRSLGFE